MSSMHLNARLVVRYVIGVISRMLASKCCVFCGKAPPSVKITKEHVLAKKFRDLFPEAPNQHRWDNKVFSYFGAENLSFVRNVPQGPFNMTVRSVCNECNNGWLSAMEGNAETYLMGLVYGRQLLSSDDMRIVVSAWAAKTSAVYALCHRDDFRAVPDYHYSYLRGTGWAPPYTHIWRGFGEFNSNTMLRYVRGCLVRDQGEQDHFHLSTIWIGHMVFFVFGFPNEFAEDALSEKISTLDVSPLERIWPLERAAERNLRPLVYDEVRELGALQF
ncbi:hypothetical protein PszF2a_13910 [Stutzerimonas stutzeri]|nr:hypothetical protein PszF2a_13910 [Stutzerimonas stutzeri]